MTVYAAVMTGPGLGAIATIQLFGDAAEGVLQEVFRSKGGKPFQFTTGRIVLGHIVDGGETVDEVTVGCEDAGTLAIHCHGNPLIVQRIMALLRRQGAQAVPGEQLLARISTSRRTCDAIGLEAKLALTAVTTVEGAAILSNQVKGGLSAKVRQWQDRLDSMSLEETVAEAGDILVRSEPARLIVSGCTIALVGPPNTGKSTLLNTLAGREKAIVSDVRGTTRDWVSAEIHIPPLAATVIDTAGLDPLLAADAIDQAAQRKGEAIIERTDLVLLVSDQSQPANQIAQDLMDQLAHKRTIVVLNKADLPPQFDPACLPAHWREVVRVSAQQGRGLDDLIRAIHRACNVAGFDRYTPIAFTDRQRRLLEALQRSDSKPQARSILSELLDSPSALSAP